MEIYNATGVLKSGTLRVTKPIGALVIVSSRKIEELTNEKISIHIERKNGDNDVLASNIPLKAFIGCSLFGDGKALNITGTGLSAICEIANLGSVELGENESIVITLTDLISTVTYGLHGIETPVTTPEMVLFIEKVMLTGQKQRTFEVGAFDEGMLIGSFDKVQVTYPTREGTRTVELTSLELRAIASDMGLISSGATAQISNTLINLVGAHSIEIFSNNQVNLVLRDVNHTSKL